MNRVGSMVLALSLAFPLSSCAVKKTMTREGLVTGTASQKTYEKFARPPGHPVAGYTTVDQDPHSFQGYAWIEGDTMVFHSSETWSGMGSLQPEAQRRVALSDLTSVDGVENGVKRTALFAIVVSAFFSALVYMAITNPHTDVGF